MTRMNRIAALVAVTIVVVIAKSQAAPIQIDLGGNGRVQSGWTALTNSPGPVTVTSDFAATGTDVTISFPGINEYRDRGDFADPLGPVIEDFGFNRTTSTTSVLIENLAAGDYALTTYHNDSCCAGQFRQSATNVLNASSFDLSNAQGIISGTTTPVTSLVTFSTDGLSDIEVIFGHDAGGIGGVINGIELDGTLAVVPEPASIAIWSLIGLAFAGFGYYRIRRKN